MKIPLYEPQVSPDFAVRPPSLGRREQPDFALARGVEQAGAELQGLGQHFAVVEAKQEHARMAVQAASMTRQLNDVAQEMIDRPDIGLTPAEAEQRAYQGMQERIEAAAKTIPREDFRNVFTAHLLTQASHHALQVRVATGKARISDAVAGDAEEAGHEVNAYVLEPTDEGRAMIFQERRARLQQFVASHVLTPKQAEAEMHKWSRTANIGAAEHDGSIQPEETIRNLLHEEVDDQGQTRFSHYGLLTIQERSVAAHNVRTNQRAQNEDAEKARKAAEESDMAVVYNAIKRGAFGGGASGLPFQRSDFDVRIQGWSFEHQHSVGAAVETFLKNPSKADERESHRTAARLLTGRMQLPEEELARRYDQAMTTQINETMTPEDVEKVTRGIDEERKHRDTAAGVNATKEQAAKAQADRKARTRGLQELQRIAPRVSHGRIADPDALQEARDHGERIVTGAVDAGQDPVAALNKARPEIERLLHDGNKAAGDAIYNDRLKKFPAFPAMPEGVEKR